MNNPEMKSRMTAVFLLWIMFGLTPGFAYSQDNFYAGKTVTLIATTAPGGTGDLRVRAMAPFFKKHLQGNPTVVVEYISGGGGRKGANHLYNKVRPDGLTIGSNIGGLFLQQIFGAKGIEFDGRKFEYLGGPAIDNPVCALTKASGITSIEKWFAAKEPVKLGGVGPGGTASDVARIVQAALNLPIKVVEPYKGTADIKLASEGGELAGGTGGARGGGRATLPGGAGRVEQFGG